MIVLIIVLIYPPLIAGNIANAKFPLHKSRAEETLSPGGSNSSLPQLVTVGRREKKEKNPYNVLLESNLQVVAWINFIVFPSLLSSV